MYLIFRWAVTDEIKWFTSRAMASRVATAASSGKLCIQPLLWVSRWTGPQVSEYSTPIHMCADLHIHYFIAIRHLCTERALSLSFPMVLFTRGTNIMFLFLYTSCHLRWYKNDRAWHHRVLHLFAIVSELIRTIDLETNHSVKLVELVSWLDEEALSSSATSRNPLVCNYMHR